MTLTPKKLFYITFWLTFIGLSVLVPAVFPHVGLLSDQETLGGAAYLAMWYWLAAFTVARMVCAKDRGEEK